MRSNNEGVFEIGSFSFDIKNRGTLKDNKDVIINASSFGFNLIISESDNTQSVNDYRTLVLSPSEDIKTVLREIVNDFKIPNLRKSKIKLKFILLTSANGHLNDELTKDFENFLSLLNPVVKFQTSFQVKYFDPLKLNGFNEFTAEMFIGSRAIAKIDSRDERGRDQVYNFVHFLLPKDHTLTKPNDIYIPDWGMVQYDWEMSKFMTGLRRLLGFSDDKHMKLPELMEIDFWIVKVNEFYMKQSSEMLGLFSDTSGTVIPPEIYQSKLHPALSALQSNNPRTVFDLINSAVHDPKSMAAAYFPDDHKFAVYLPVYLPLFLPIFVALVAYIKEAKKKRKKQLVDDSKKNN